MSVGGSSDGLQGLPDTARRGGVHGLLHGVRNDDDAASGTGLHGPCAPFHYNWPQGSGVTAPKGPFSAVSIRSSARIHESAECRSVYANVRLEACHPIWQSTAAELCHFFGDNLPPTRPCVNNAGVRATVSVVFATFGTMSYLAFFQYTPLSQQR